MSLNYSTHLQRQGSAPGQVAHGGHGEGVEARRVVGEAGGGLGATQAVAEAAQRLVFVHQGSAKGGLLLPAAA